MNKIGWFYTGFYTCAIFFSILFSYFDLGNPFYRTGLFILSLMGIGYSIIVFKDKKELKKKNKNEV